MLHIENLFTLYFVIFYYTVYIFFYNRIIPESPRWLLARGKSTEADMALERIAKYNGYCTVYRTRTKTAEREVCVKSNTTPVKPERKSHVTSVDLQRARSDENQREEATNLFVNRSEPVAKRQKGKCVFSAVADLHEATIPKNSVYTRIDFLFRSVIREHPVFLDDFKLIIQ